MGSHRICLFLEGTPELPENIDSKRIVELMRKYDATFQYYDVLQDLEMKAKIVEYTSWVTYPQLFVNNKLLGLLLFFLII